MRILHILAQRPSLTGSGITLDAMVRHAAGAGHDQRVVVGVPGSDPAPEVGGLAADRIHPLVFDRGPLDFAVPGMSDVMPYPSSRFSALSQEQLAAYRCAWVDHLRPILAEFQPDLIQSHHVWLMSALLKDLAPDVPVVTQCHATGIRQMALCPHLENGVRTGCSRNDAFLVLHVDHKEQLAHCLGVPDDRIHVVGAGYREDLFHPRGREPGNGSSLLYVGKYSAAKGVPWLLDAVERVAAARPSLRLHIAGGGAGDEAELLRARMDRMAPVVVQHGQLSQPELGDLARRCNVCVLPSFYEGLPLVLAEALACGCRLVATNLPGIQKELAPRFGEALNVIDLPRLEAVDRPLAEDVPAFVDRLERALGEALAKEPLGDPGITMPGALSSFTWNAVFDRVEKVWLSLR